jgi:hypothetical protein
VRGGRLPCDGEGDSHPASSTAALKATALQGCPLVMALAGSVCVRRLATRHFSKAPREAQCTHRSLSLLFARLSLGRGTLLRLALGLERRFVAHLRACRRAVSISQRHESCRTTAGPSHACATHVGSTTLTARRAHKSECAAPYASAAWRCPLSQRRTHRRTHLGIARALVFLLVAAGRLVHNNVSAPRLSGRGVCRHLRSAWVSPCSAHPPWWNLLTAPGAHTLRARFSCHALTRSLVRRWLSSAPKRGCVPLCSREGAPLIFAPRGVRA